MIIRFEELSENAKIKCISDFWGKVAPYDDQPEGTTREDQERNILEVLKAAQENGDNWKIDESGSWIIDGIRL